MVQCRYENPCRNTCRFDGIVVLDLAAIGQRAKFLQENGDQVRRSLEERFVRIGPQWRQRFEPLRRRPVLVELALLDFCCCAYRLLGLGVADDHEMPWLQVGATRRRACCLQRRFDNVSRHGAVRKLAYRASPVDIGVELLYAPAHLFYRKLLVRAQWLARILTHRQSLSFCITVNNFVSFSETALPFTDMPAS